MVGEHISYRSLGFPSLEALLNSTGKFTVNHFGGSSVVQAKVTDKTQHLTDLIKRQKSKPPKKKPVINVLINLFFCFCHVNYHIF